MNSETLALLSRNALNIGPEIVKETKGTDESIKMSTRYTDNVRKTTGVPIEELVA